MTRPVVRPARSSFLAMSLRAAETVPEEEAGEADAAVSPPPAPAAFAGDGGGLMTNRVVLPISSSSFAWMTRPVVRPARSSSLVMSLEAAVTVPEEEAGEADARGLAATASSPAGEGVCTDAERNEAAVAAATAAGRLPPPGARDGLFSGSVLPFGGAHFSLGSGSEGAEVPGPSGFSARGRVPIASGRGAVPFRSAAVGAARRSTAPVVAREEVRRASDATVGKRLWDKWRWR
ncbi:unnamed protein product [Laminaria digitata]